MSKNHTGKMTTYAILKIDQVLIKLTEDSESDSEFSDEDKER